MNLWLKALLNTVGRIPCLGGSCCQYFYASLGLCQLPFLQLPVSSSGQEHSLLLHSRSQLSVRSLLSGRDLWHGYLIRMAGTLVLVAEERSFCFYVRVSKALCWLCARCHNGKCKAAFGESCWEALTGESSPMTSSGHSRTVCLYAKIFVISKY